MKRNPMAQDKGGKRGRRHGTATDRGENQALDSDVEQARRELRGEEASNPGPDAEDRLPEDERWDPVPGSPGHKAPTVPAADEQMELEDLVEEGVADAEREQELAANRRRQDEP